VRTRGWSPPRWIGALPAAGIALALAFVLAQPAVATTTTAAQVATFGKPVAGSPLFVSFTNTFNPDLYTTVFSVSATSTDGSTLAYRWSLTASCGSLTAPGADQPTNGYYHGPAAKPPNGCDPPPGEEILTKITVDVFRAQDLDPNDPTHGPKKGSPYFEYFMTARAQDDADTQGIPTGAQLDYFGAGPAPTATPTPTPTARPVESPATRPTAATSSFPWWIAVLVLVIVVVAVAYWLYTHRVTTVEKPPVEKCGREKAAVAAAEAALKEAQARFAPIDAAMKRSIKADSLSEEKKAESARLDKAAGATKHTDTGSTPGGPSFTKVHWSYKYPSEKAAAERARAEAEAAATAAAEAQKAFDALGGMNTWNQLHNAETDAESALKTAKEALAKCLGVAAPAAPPAPPTTTDGGGTATGGPAVATGPDTPTTQEKPKCKEGEKRTVEVCSGTITENLVGQLKMIPSGFFESGDNVRDLLNKFRQVDAAVDMAGKVKDAFTNPISSIIDTVEATGQKMHKLPPSTSPSGYVDMMKGALVDGIDDLTHKLDDFHGTITDLMAAWPINTYTYVGRVTCECKGGQMVVVDRSFTVEYKPPAGLGRRELTSGGSSGMITKDDIARKSGTLLRELVNQNAAAEQILVDMQKKVDQAGC
jgi:hypothetical protein